MDLSEGVWVRVGEMEGVILPQSSPMRLTLDMNAQRLLKRFRSAQISTSIGSTLVSQHEWCASLKLSWQGGSYDAG